VRALITGASGFVGPHLRRHLQEMGDEVARTDRSDGGPDLLDPARIETLVARANPDVVYHLAGQADVAASWADPRATFRVNAEGTLNVLEACHRRRVDRVLVVSTAEVYGHVTPNDLPITEHHPLSPRSPYAASKAAAEMVAMHYAGMGLQVIRSRAFNHLGPGQSERFVAPALAGRMLRADADGADTITVGRLDTRRDFTDVRDVVRAYRLLVDRGESGEVYNVCSGTAWSIADVADAIMSHLGTRFDLVPDPDLQRPADVPVLQGDNSKLRTLAGWEPTISFEHSLADLVGDLRSRGRN